MEPVPIIYEQHEDSRSTQEIEGTEVDQPSTDNQVEQLGTRQNDDYLLTRDPRLMCGCKHILMVTRLIRFKIDIMTTWNASNRFPSLIYIYANFNN